MKTERTTTSETNSSACLIVGVDFGIAHFSELMSECVLLAQTAGLHASEVLKVKRSAPDPATFIGSGKLEEIHALCMSQKPEVVIFANPLGPVQQRNLERALQCQVIDRTALILEIFAQRAQSHEGKLQVQLAQTQYQVTRLVRQWSHLERQRGGIGVRGGPGERQLELDKRMLRTKIKGIKERIEKVQKQRDTQRRARVRGGSLRVAIVGYTNAGKSTLFSALTNSPTYVADQLFATLDPTTRRIKFAEHASIVVSDTVGFVRDLPHLLVASFKSTLQEAMDADLLLHVVDASNPNTALQMQSVDEVLEEIEAADIPQWIVYNKIDLSGHSAGHVERAVGDDDKNTHSFYLSAANGEGLSVLREALVEAAHHANLSLQHSRANSLTMQAEPEAAAHH